MSTQTRAPFVARKTGPSQTSAVRRRATIPNELTTLPPIVDEALRSPGRELEAETRDFMEPRFGHDFSKVRIHSDGAAAAAAQAVNARACTFGADVFFDASEYAPSTPHGRELLAHELAHTIQQRDPHAAPPGPEANGEIESGARAAGRSIAAGGDISINLPACGLGLSCSPKDDEEAKRRAAAIAEAQAVATQNDPTENEEDEIPVTPMAISGVPYNPKPATKVAKKAKVPKSDELSRFLPGGFTDADIYGDLDAKKKKEEDEKKAAQQKEDEGRDVRLTALRARLRHGFSRSVLADMLDTLPMRDLQILKKYGFKWNRRGPDRDSLVEAIDKWAASSDSNTPDPQLYENLLKDEQNYYQRNYAALQNYNQRVEAIASSGPASLTGRVIGSGINAVFHTKNADEWLAAFGGLADNSLPAIASAKAENGGTGGEESPPESPPGIYGEPPTPAIPTETRPDRPATAAAPPVDTITPSRPVAGFARDIEPAPAPVPVPSGGTVSTRMPPARTVQNGRPTYGGVMSTVQPEPAGSQQAVNSSRRVVGFQPPPKDVTEKGLVEVDIGAREYIKREYFGDVGASGEQQSRYHINIQLDPEGMMDADFVLRGEGRRSGTLFGKEEFLEAKRHFEQANGPDSVKGVHGRWGDGDNLETFNSRVKLWKDRGLSDDAAMVEAAKKTKTGEWAAAAGFNQVKIINVQGTPGKFTNVEVDFTK